jgi:hypothetical protein
MPKFQVTETFVLESRSWFVLAGSIAEGVVQRGMLVGIPFNASVSMTAAIDSIEFLDKSGGVAKTCLCIKYADEEELSLWQGLNIGNELLEVKEQPTGAAPPGAA